MRLIVVDEYTSNILLLEAAANPRCLRTRKLFDRLKNQVQCLHRIARVSIGKRPPCYQIPNVSPQIS